MVAEYATAALEDTNPGLCCVVLPQIAVLDGDDGRMAIVGRARQSPCADLQPQRAPRNSAAVLALLHYRGNQRKKTVPNAE